jgi:hypothetical protein
MSVEIHPAACSALAHSVNGRQDRLAVAAGGGPRELAAVVVNDHRQISLPLAMRDPTDDLTAIAATLNSRLRKALAWRTPAEALNEHLTTATAWTARTPGPGRRPTIRVQSVGRGQPPR